MFDFYNPTRIHFGSGSLASLPEQINSLSAKRVMMVTGEQSFKTSGNLGKTLELMHKYETFHHRGIGVNPDFSEVETLIDTIHKQNCDVIVAIGGGSVLDTAKIAALFSTQPVAADILLNNYKSITLVKKIPLIAIPTTSGTGSEVTKFSSLWDKKSKQKLSFEHNALYPDIAIVDPKLVLSAPSSLTAYSGLDALCQAIESYWSKNSQPVSDVLAQRAIELIVTNLPKACQYPEHLEYRESMSQGSLFAGLAFSNTKTTACHSISYPLTSYFGVPHGLAVALTLPSMLVFNAPLISEKIEFLKKIFSKDSAQGISQALTELMLAINVPTTFRELGIQSQDIPTILDNSFTPERMLNNPREVSRMDLEKILTELL